ncbi:MAG: cryptochrome/photolyase family protein [Phycisphaeraceae bacterium]|nr:MAG: cryptochrome/photolyase family protein [Phycisphaeraceae bacterium]
MPARRGGQLILVLGDQLDRGSAALRVADRARDTVLMMEVARESTHVPSHRQRTVMFLAAMRHHAAWLEREGFRVRYVRLTDDGNTQTFGGEVARAVAALSPAGIRVVEPGEWRVLHELEEAARGLGVPMEVIPDGHFLASRDEFAAWASGKRGLVMETFYRHQRKRLGILMEPDGTPTGGAWNFDEENRESFGPKGPGPRVPEPPAFEPDEVVRGVEADVARALPDLPGRPGRLIWPVTHEQATSCLEDFVRRRLERFGPYEDAMWEGRPYLYHSVLSAPLNLKLLDPRACVMAAVSAYRAGRAPLRSVEGFVRQIIGWREFIRGVYWREGPGYAERNGLDHRLALPAVYWTGETTMNCVKVCVNEVLDRSYGHHIQRLMVTGNLALLLGVNPREVSDWYLGMYADGVDWATLPNALGMSQHADGGVVGTKPYAASGKYIKRMSNYCAGCRHDPGERTGERACPFNALYWDFLIRHRGRFGTNPRMAMILKNVDRMPEAERVEVRVSASRARSGLGLGLGLAASHVGRTTGPERQ